MFRNENREQDQLLTKVKELQKELIKTKEQLKQEEESKFQLQEILNSVPAQKKSNIITIKSATKIEFVNVDEIVYCNADEAYTLVELLSGKTITAARPLSTFEKMLDFPFFFRISKSHLINTDHVRTFFKDRNQILLEGDILLDVARRRRVEFLKFLK